MLKHNLLISYRTLLRDKGFTLLNIGGLALGMSVAILIGLWMNDELSFNHSFENHEKIAEVVHFETVKGERLFNTSTPLPLGKVLNDSYGSDFQYIVNSTQDRTFLLSNEEKKFTGRGRYMESDVAEMLSLEMQHGTRKGLEDINSILLSSSMAARFFGKENPVGEVIKLGEETEMKVTGVFSDFAKNSKFKEVEFILPFKMFLTFNFAKNNMNNWDDGFLRTYVQIPLNSTFEKVSQRVENVFADNLKAEDAASLQPKTFLHPMDNWRLNSEFENGVAITSIRMQTIWMYGMIGLFVLLLACINFMNLSTARSSRRAKEVGIRKSIGSLRGQLVGQFLSESFLVSMVGFVIAIGLAYSILPWFNEIADKTLFVPWRNIYFWLLGFGFVFLTSILAGSYPAFYLSSLKPVKVLKGKMSTKEGNPLFRKALVVFQFSISISLIIGTVIIYQQIQYAQSRPLGYEQENLIRIFKMNALNGTEDAFRNELMQSGAIIGMAESATRLTGIGSNNNGFTWQEKDPSTDPVFGTLSVSSELGELVNWKYIDGRGFSADLASDSSGIVINEAAAKVFGFENPVGQTVNWNPDFRDAQDYTILGVAKDMIMRSPYEPTVPTVFYMEPEYYSWVFLKLNPQISTEQALAKIDKVYSKFVPFDIFEYNFVNDLHARKFREEVRTGSIAKLFSILAILISCLGLFGLTAYIAQQRTKEISIRKVLGASTFNLWHLLSKDFILLVFISCFIAIPVAIYFLNGWLENFEYRVEMSWWIFVGVMLCAMVITLITISFQTIKVALANPASNLKE